MANGDTSLLYDRRSMRRGIRLGTAEIRTRRTWLYEADPVRVWATLSTTSAYQAWWPWLRHFSGPGLASGATWRCTVRSPLPYSLTFDVHIVEATGPRLVEATLEGDLGGTARIKLEPTDAGTLLHLRSAIIAHRRSIATMTRLIPPLARWSHDWVLSTGAQQFGEAIANGLVPENDHPLNS